MKNSEKNNIDNITSMNSECVNEIDSDRNDLESFETQVLTKENSKSKNSKIILFSKPYLGEKKNSELCVNDFIEFFNSVNEAEIIPEYIFFIRDSVKIFNLANDELISKLNYLKKLRVKIIIEKESSLKYSAVSEIAELKSLSYILMIIMNNSDLLAI